MSIVQTALYTLYILESCYPSLFGGNITLKYAGA